MQRMKYLSFFSFFENTKYLSWDLIVSGHLRSAKNHIGSPGYSIHHPKRILVPTYREFHKVLENATEHPTKFDVAFTVSSCSKLFGVGSSILESFCLKLKASDWRPQCHRLSPCCTPLGLLAAYSQTRTSASESNAQMGEETLPN
jgi:hypothetical protein